MLSTIPEDCSCECLLPPGSSTQCIPALLLSARPPMVAIFEVDITRHKQRANNTHNSMHSSLSELWGERSFSPNIKVTIDHFSIKKKKACGRLKLFPLQTSLQETQATDFCIVEHCSALLGVGQRVYAQRHLGAWTLRSVWGMHPVLSPGRCLI